MASLWYMFLAYQSDVIYTVALPFNIAKDEVPTKSTSVTLSQLKIYCLLQTLPSFVYSSGQTRSHTQKSANTKGPRTKS